MTITAAELQTELGTNPLDPQVIRHHGNFATYQDWYISGGVTVPGVVKHVRTTASDSAATQAAAVLTSLRLGPA